MKTENSELQSKHQQSIFISFYIVTKKLSYHIQIVYQQQQQQDGKTAVRNCV